MFVLLKILLFFFHPLVWIIILFVYAAVSKKESRRKFCFRLGLGLLLFFTNPFFIRVLCNWYQPEPVTIPAGTSYEAGIVLGGFISYNLKNDEAHFNNASDRFIQTALLYKTGRIRKIIIAAGNGYMVKNNFREAFYIRDRLMELGIPSSNIFTDPDSRNTLENAVNAKRITDSVHIQQRCLLITSAMHMPRALQVFRKTGLQVDPFPCDYTARAVSNNIMEDYILPASWALVYWDNLIKEVTGRVAYQLTGRS